MWNTLHFGILVLLFRLTVQKPTVPGPIQIEVPLNKAVTIHSPGYPDEIYQANTDISWEFHTSSSKYMKLVFIYFDIEAHQNCIWDKVEIVNGRCNTMDEAENERLCNPLDDEYQFFSDSTFMCVLFHSDHVIQRLGFNASVSAAQASTTIETPSMTSKSSSSQQLPSHSSTTVSSKSSSSLSPVSSPSTSTTLLLPPISSTPSPFSSSSSSSSSTLSSTPSTPSANSSTSSSKSSSSPSSSSSTTLSSTPSTQSANLSTSSSKSSSSPSSTSTVKTTVIKTITISSNVSSQNNDLTTGNNEQNSGQVPSTVDDKTASSTPFQSNKASTIMTITNGNTETTIKSSQSTSDSNTFTTSTNVINEAKTSSLNKLTTQTPSAATTNFAEPTTVDICEQSSVIVDNPMSIVTPGFLDQKYPLNRSCTISLTANNGYEIMLNVDKFELETHQKCTWDHVKLVYNMTQVKLCGVLEPDSRITPYNNCNPNRLNVYDVVNSHPVCLFQSGTSVNLKTQTITLTFFSDYIVNKRGFKINVTPLASDFDELPPMSSKTTEPTTTTSHTHFLSTKSSSPGNTSPINNPGTTTESTFASYQSSSSMPAKIPVTESTSITMSKSSTSDNSSVIFSLSTASVTSGQASELPSGAATHSSQEGLSSSSQPSLSSLKPPSSTASASSTLSSSESQTTKLSTYSPKSTFVSNTVPDGDETTSSQPSTSTSSTIISTTSEAGQTEITMCQDSQTSSDLHDVGTLIVRSPVTEYGKYPLNKTCFLTIDNIGNKILKFVFLGFNLELHHECKWDYLEVKPQGEDPQKFCGDKLPEERETNSPVVDIVFHSDHVVADKGFVLHIQYFNVPTTVVIPTSPMTSIQSTMINQVTDNPSSSVSTPTVNTSTTETTTASPIVERTDGEYSGLTTVVNTESSGQKTFTVDDNTASSTSLNSNEASTITTIKTTIKSSQFTSDSNKLTTSNNLMNAGKTSTINTLTTQTPSDATTDILPPTTVDICEQPSIIVDRHMSIVTPGFLDQRYPLNRTCTIALTANNGYDITLRVEKFELEIHQKCTWDHVKLEYNTTQVKFCGVLEAHSQITPYNNCNPNRMNVYDVIKSHPVCLFQSDTSVNLKTQSITLTFYSDNVVNKSGFKINVTPLASDINEHIPMSSKTTEHQYTLTTTADLTHSIHTGNTTPLKDITTSTESSTASSSLLSAEMHSTESTSSSTSKTLPIENSPIASFSHSTKSSTSDHVSETSSGIVTQSLQEVSKSESQHTFTFTSQQSSKTHSDLNINTHTEPATTSPLVPGSTSPIATSSTTVNKSTKQSTAVSSTNGVSSTVSASSAVVHQTTSKETTQDPVTDACSGNNPMFLDGETGYIESPGYHSNEYPPNSHCRWKITGAKPKVVMIVFETFDVEYSSGCKFDTLNIFEIHEDGSTLKKVWKKCGNVIPELLSSKTDILVEFISDSFAEKTGFRLKYYRIETNTDKTYTCAAGMMPCLDTETCIPAEWWCDGMEDCQDQTDEKSCDLCGEDEFQCVNGSCISTELRCDNIEQCPYGTDERSCVSIAEPGDNSPVLVNVRNDWLPLCYDDSATNRANDICNVAGFRSSKEVGANQMDDVDTYSKVQGDKTSLNFVASAECHEQKTTRLLCTESECGKKGENVRQKRVVGGSKSMKGVWRWSVALRIGNSVVCGASIISSEWVVTAGHCVYELVDNPQVLSIIAGVNDITDTNREIRYVSEVVIHPKYDFIFEADIALLRLQSPLTFNNDIQPICLPWDRRQFSPMDICYITGYGVWDMMHYHTTVTPKYLREVKTKIVDHETCRNMYSYKTMIHDTMLCAGYAVGGMDACKGDSGGGLMCQSESGRWMLAGVVSWGDMCGSRNRPGVYTRVTSFLDWIHEKTNPDGPQSLVCDFENGWCGYQDISAGNYIWTRRPGDKYVKGSVLYASKTSAASQDKVSTASLLSPPLTLTTDSCLSFMIMLSGNSNITVTVYSINTEGEPDTPLFGIISHFPAADVWKSLDFNVPASIPQLLIVSQNDAGGISGLGLDNITMVAGRCQGSNFMECNFDEAGLCHYTQTYGQNTAQWVVTADIDGAGNHLSTGGEFEDFGYLAVSQLISPTVSTNYISIPHCLTFSFNKQSDTDTELVVSTYISIGGELANQQIYWSSEHSEVGQWFETSVTIPHKMFNHVVFEVRREVYSKDIVEILLDDIRITDGMCV